MGDYRALVRISANDSNRNNSNINSIQKPVRRMMERSLKLPKKIKPEWRARNFSSRGTTDGPAGVEPSSRTLHLSSRATRVVERTLARSLVHAIACASLKSIPIDPSRNALLPFLNHLARSHSVSFALAPFRWGRAIAHARSPTITTWTTLRRRCRRPSPSVRPTDRPRSVSRA